MQPHCRVRLISTLARLRYKDIIIGLRTTTECTYLASSQSSRHYPEYALACSTLRVTMSNVRDEIDPCASVLHPQADQGHSDNTVHIHPLFLTTLSPNKYQQVENMAGLGPFSAPLKDSKGDILTIIQSPEPLPVVSTCS